MKAALRLKYGPPAVINVEQTETPKPKAHEILVRVHAATVNRTDCAILSGKPFVMQFFTGLFKPKLPTLGTDFAGIVEAVGEQVADFKVGDRVWGFNDQGMATQAQYAVISTREAMLKIPADISYEQAAASAEGAHYAYNFINKLTLKAGQKVLVNGGTGAIGSALIQMLKSLDLHVTAVCGTQSLARVAALGADRVIDYSQEDFTKEALKYDFVFDAVGKSTFARCKPVLQSNGIYISSELGPNAQNVYLPLFTKFTQGPKVVFPIPSNIPQSLDFIQKLLVSGQFRPLIDRHYPLEDIRAAYTYVASGQKIGNVVLSFE
jgi:NADPH:quinone reductase-like Zn-dependent oxidoreductase